MGVNFFYASTPLLVPISLLIHIGKLLHQTTTISQWLNYFLFNLQSNVGDSVYMLFQAHRVK